jgi:hypothetical protein
MNKELLADIMFMIASYLDVDGFYQVIRVCKTFAKMLNKLDAIYNDPKLIRNAQFLNWRVVHVYFSIYHLAFRFTHETKRYSYKAEITMEIINENKRQKTLRVIRKLKKTQKMLVGDKWKHWRLLYRYNMTTRKGFGERAILLLSRREDGADRIVKSVYEQIDIDDEFIAVKLKCLRSTLAHSSLGDSIVFIVEFNSTWIFVYEARMSLFDGDRNIYTSLYDQDQTELPPRLSFIIKWLLDDLKFTRSDLVNAFIDYSKLITGTINKKAK